MKQKSASLLFALSTLVWIFALPLKAVDGSIATTAKIKDQSPPLLGRIFENLSYVRLHIEGQLDFHPGQPLFKDISFDGSVWMSDVFRETTPEFDSTGKKNDKDLLTEFLVGTRDLEVRARGTLSEKGDLKARIDFRLGDKQSYFPIVIQNAKIGRVQMKIRALSFNGKGLNLNQNMKENPIRVESECFLEVDNKPISPNLKPTFKEKGEWMPVLCKGWLQYEPKKEDWFFSIKLGSRSRPLDIKTTKEIVEPSSYCDRTQAYVKEQLIQKYQSYKEQGLEMPFLFADTSSDFFEYKGSFNHPEQIETNFHVFVRPRFGKVTLPQGAYGLYAELPQNSIVSICYDDLTESPRLPNTVIDFFDLDRRYWIFGPKEIQVSGAKIRWNPINQAKNDIFSIFDGVRLIGPVAKVVDRVSDKVLDLPATVVGDLTPDAHIERILISEESITMKTRGAIVRKIKLKTKD